METHSGSINDNPTNRNIIISTFKNVDDLSPSDFEIFVRDVFVSAGWSDASITEVNKEYKHGDGGVDIFAYKNDRKYAIEVKQRSIAYTVDISALNQLVTGARLAKVENMILVTNSYFTSEVKARALRLGVELLNRDQLQSLWVEKRSEIGRRIKPRRYQARVINETIESFEKGRSKLLIEMATGLGKTYTVAHIVKILFEKYDHRLRVLFVAHQIEILLQSVTAFKNVLGIGAYSFSACFGGSKPENTDFIFASFDTLHSQINDLKNDKYDVVIIDEAHHTPARTYAEVVSYLSPRLLIGLTATPFRTDNKDVMEYFGGSDGHIGKYDLIWGLKHRYLAFPKYMVLLDDLDQSKIDQLESGLTIHDLDKYLFLHKKDIEVISIIEKTIAEKAISNVKAIVFCRSVKHIKHLIGFFPMGSATFVHSRMSEQERRNNIREFREGAYRYILVCNLFNEGIDIPETNVLVFMRYTGSRTIWLQQLGRGLRKTANKDSVLVLDFVGSLDRLADVTSLQTAVARQPLDEQENDSEDDYEERIHKQSLHDSTIEVSYNKNAPQVLKLIENLRYRLSTRDVMIDQIRKYVNKYNVVPTIADIEDCLSNITADQISSHFDSYYKYLCDSVPEYIDKAAYEDKVISYMREFKNKFGICPTDKAVSLYYYERNLTLFSETDVSHIAHIHNICPNSFAESIEEPGSESCDDVNHIDSNKFSALENRLLEKWHNKSTLKDIIELNESNRDEIKNVFGSYFGFLNALKEYKK